MNTHKQAHTRRQSIIVAYPAKILEKRNNNSPRDFRKAQLVLRLPTPWLLLLILLVLSTIRRERLSLSLGQCALLFSYSTSFSSFFSSSFWLFFSLGFTPKDTDTALQDNFMSHDRETERHWVLFFKGPPAGDF